MEEALLSSGSCGLSTAVVLEVAGGHGLKLIRVEPLALLLLDGNDEADNGCAAASS